MGKSGSNRVIITHLRLFKKQKINLAFTLSLSASAFYRFSTQSKWFLGASVPCSFVATLAVSAYARIYSRCMSVPSISHIGPQSSAFVCMPLSVIQ